MKQLENKNIGQFITDLFRSSGIFLKKMWERANHNAAFIAIGSLLWLLYKSGRKPSRIAYPCQKAAAANVVVFLPFAFTGWASHIRRFFRNKLNIASAVKPMMVVCATILVFASADFIVEKFAIQKSWTEYRMAHKGPVGRIIGVTVTTTAAGAVTACNVIYETVPPATVFDSPHRVVALHNSDASSWVGAGNPHEHLDQAEINEMVEVGVMALAGKNDSTEAWTELIPYKTGESVAIKLNFNNARDWTSDPYMNPNASVVNALIDGLTAMGVPPESIWLVDPSRRISDSFRGRITNLEVLFYTAYSSSDIRVVTTPYIDIDSVDISEADFSEDGTSAIRMAQVLVEADHIINVPQLKGHGSTSITLGIKNQYGSAIIGTESRSYWHKYFFLSGTAYRTGPNPAIEIYRNPHIANKTRLTIGDGIYGHPTKNSPSDDDPLLLFESFGNNPPEILFFGVDPIAVDSVMFDYLQRESSLRGFTARNDDILVDAADLGLGLLEHWNNDIDRQYGAIDYVEIEL